MVDMSGKVILVTGATNGIGKVAACELTRMGATVVLVALSSFGNFREAFSIDSQPDSIAVVSRADQSMLPISLSKCLY